MATPLQKFHLAVAADIAAGLHSKGRIGACGHHLGPRMDGEHARNAEGKEICADCAQDAWDGFENIGGLSRGGRF